MSSEATVSGLGTEKLEGGFARKASGLVRDFSQLDAWIYNVLALNLVINIAFIFVAVTTTYPGASLPLAVLMCAVFCSLEAVVYAFFVTIMPRSGGDYVFQSRVLGGGPATLFAFTAVCLTQVVFTALSAYLGATLVLSPFLLLLGSQYDWSWALDAGNWLATKTGIFVFCCAIISWVAFINIKGLRTYAIIQRYCFWTGIVLLAIVLVFLIFASKDDFISNFNGFLSKNYGTSNAYAETIRLGGTADTSFSFHDTLLAMVPLSLILAFPMWGAAQAGEIKRANNLRANIGAILGAEVFVALGIALIAALVVSRVGSDFLYASGTLYFDGADTPLPVPPFFGFFAALATSSPIFIWIAFLMFVSWYFMLMPNGVLAGARVLTAMSIDRVLPSWFGHVNRRTHTPVNAIIVMSILALAVAALYAYSTSFQELTLSMILPSLTGFGVTMVAAIVFPRRRRAMYEASVASKYRFGGVPVMSVLAVGFLAFVVFVDYQALFADELGINSTKGLIMIGVLYGIAATTWIVSSVYRKQHDHLDLSVAYKELPVE